MGNMQTKRTAITPKELSEQRFKPAMRGYSMKQVDEFMFRIVADYTALYNGVVQLDKETDEQRRTELLRNLLT